MSQKQPRTKTGKYDTFEHGAGAVSLGSPAGSAAERSRARYKELQDRRWDLETEATVHAAAAVASATREMFPDARYITFGDKDFSLEPRAVLDSKLNELASSNGGTEQREAYLEWAHGDAVMDDDYDVSVGGLAYGLKDHGGKLDGILTEAPKGARHDVVLGIDEVLARAAQSDDNLARGIVTPAAPFAEPG